MAYLKQNVDRNWFLQPKKESIRSVTSKLWFANSTQLNERFVFSLNMCVFRIEEIAKCCSRRTGPSWEDDWIRETASIWWTRFKQKKEIKSYKRNTRRIKSVQSTRNFTRAWSHWSVEKAQRAVNLLIKHILNCRCYIWLILDWTLRTGQAQIWAISHWEILHLRRAVQNRWLVLNQDIVRLTALVTTWPIPTGVNRIPFFNACYQLNMETVMPLSYAKSYNISSKMMEIMNLELNL